MSQLRSNIPWMKISQIDSSFGCRMLHPLSMEIGYWPQSDGSFAVCSHQNPPGWLSSPGLWFRLAFWIGLCVFGVILIGWYSAGFVWFSVSHVLRPTECVSLIVFRVILVGVPASRISWGYLPVIWMVFSRLLNIISCLLSFGYRHVDFITVSVCHISSVSILSY